MDIVERLRGSVTSSGGVDCRDPNLLLGAADEIERLRGGVEEAVETLESMDLHIDNPLYNRLRSLVEQEGGTK